MILTPTLSSYTLKYANDLGSVRFLNFGSKVVLCRTSHTL